MSARGAMLLLGLAASIARGAAPEDAPLRDLHWLPLPAEERVGERARPHLRWQNYVVPVLENTALSFSLLAFSNLITGEEFALISAQSVARNLQPRSWTFDVDYYLTNQFGHALHGNYNFNAARSAGLDFWWSALYTTLTSLTWELFFESEAPSVNDQLTTPIAGSLLGEVLHRVARQLRGNGGPRWLGVLGGALLDPFGALNPLLVDGVSADDPRLDPLFVRWQFGASGSVVIDQLDGLARARSPLQAQIAVLLVSGAPWDPRSIYDSPLSYFDFRADLSFPFRVVGNLFIRGLLTGQRFESPGGRLQGVWGLFGEYDYASPAIVRASAVGLGPGAIFQLEVGANWYLQVGGVLGASPLGAAGVIPNVTPGLARDYHVGPGVQSFLDVRVLRPRWIQLELSARHWLVVGAYTVPSGYESITYLTAAATVPIWRWLGAGAELTVMDRRAHFNGTGNEHDTGLSLRVMLSVMSEPHFLTPQN